MFLLTLFVLTCTTAIRKVHSVMPMELPIEMEEGNWLIKAQLIDDQSPIRINIIEYIKSSNGTVRGRIDFKVNDDNEHSIFYTSKAHDKRLVYNELTCALISYSEYSGLSSYLTTLGDNYFFNQLLLVGPSVLFRLPEHIKVWRFPGNHTIRGNMNNVATAKLDRYVKVWFYYKDSFETGIKRPDRVTFQGTDIHDRRSLEGIYWFDIYTIARVEQNFDTMVTPKVRLYCPQSHFDSMGIPREPLPMITENTIHFISKTKSFNAGPSMRKEVHADAKYQIARIKSSTLGEDNKTTKTETFYDYQLGLEYGIKEDGKCFASPMKQTASGMIRDSSLGYDIYKLDLNQFFNFNWKFRYLGPTTFKERDSVGMHVWQAIEKNLTIENKSHRYVVINQYLNKMADPISRYTLVGTEIYAYEEDYELGASRTTEYFFHGSELSPSESMRNFNIENCYPDSKSKKIFAMYLTCKDISCASFDQYYYQFQDKVKETLVNTGRIAASRIANIELIFNSDAIIIYITILDFPRIKDAFEMRNLKLDKKILTTSKVAISNNEEDCLMMDFNRYESSNTIAFCKTGDGNICLRIDGEKVKLVEDQNNGISCSVFMTPLKNVHRYREELPLENIQEKLNLISISFTTTHNNEMFTFTAHHVEDVSKITGDNGNNSLFDSILINTKLIEDEVKTMIVTDATDLSSCYRKCAHSVVNNCNSFSFCAYNDRVACLVSSIENIFSETISNDASCVTYLIENLSKFEKIPSKRFTDIKKSVSLDSSLEKCASFCFNTGLCKSFQYCSGTCSFSGYYTDAASDYSEDCDIYIPKVLNRFELTGKFIIENVFHTELNLDANQCAALCHDWSEKDGNCQSFNYCPARGKKSSICQLSNHFSSHNADAEFVHSDDCQNYKRSERSLINQQNNNVMIRSTHIGTLFGSIMLFVACGLVLGAIVGTLFKKFYPVNKNYSSEDNNRHTFSWSQQLNEE